ncbi:MAG: hypothetical protein LBS11_08435 [Oscillospiraceae bacterium]|jgi:hypothetical protein|nr:hypothetical protein [Oscillospiraceae bacterium]
MLGHPSLRVTIRGLLAAALIVRATTGLAAEPGAARRGVVWTDVALRLAYGADSSTLRPSSPRPNAALLVLGEDSEYRPASGPVSQNPNAALDELASELAAVTEDLASRLDGQPITITDDPNQAGLFVILDARYPSAGQYGGYLNAYNCILTITVIDSSTKETVAAATLASEYGDAIDVSQFAEGTTTIWKKLPLPSESSQIEGFAGVLAKYLHIPEIASTESAPAVLGIEGALLYLQNESFNNLYAYLRDGKTLTRGASGENAKAFQAMLIDLGAGIKADGQAGSQTITAYQSVFRDALGETVGDSLDQRAFESLVFAMVAGRDAALARSLYPDAPTELIDTLRAERLFSNQQYYSAYSLFMSLGSYGDSADRAAMCVQPWPSAGALERAGAYRGTLAELKILSTYPSDTACLVKIYARDGGFAASLFVPGGETTTIGIAPGEYMVRVGSGQAWFGAEEAFGQDGAKYSTLEFNGEDKLMRIEQEYTHTLTLLANDLPNGAAPVGADPLTWEAFAAKESE